MQHNFIFGLGRFSLIVVERGNESLKGLHTHALLPSLTTIPHHHPSLPSPNHSNTKMNTLNDRQRTTFQSQINSERSYSKEEREIIQRFWNTYDEIIILSIFSMLGIVFRIFAANFFSRFDDVFNERSALFTNLPLNCLSCFLMGLLCRGEDAMKTIDVRYSGIVGFVHGIGVESKEGGNKDD